ncbi:hypothetical protein SLEP1_g4037 [Rubroshorea leprosula]|uniref:Uncharacterized protein n=1 Tax=Rubroshorea leprosula TaxID=152421 RepID=A0AAV5HWS7_9ROSI|nr:hypothetical protein SLEP1_g4037 [Rubroshorea leprosula]
MDFLDFDNVKAEKVEAIRRFNQRQTLKKLVVLLCEVLLAFFLLSWLSKSIPQALKNAGGLVRGFVLILNRSLFCFMLVNLLILVIFVLSCRKTNNSSNIYDEYAGSYRSATGNATEELVEEPVVDKHIIIADNAVLKKRAVVETVTDEPSERAVFPVQQDALSTVGAVTVTEKKRAVGAVMGAKKKGGYQRSRSEMSTNFGNKTRPELRRSETTIYGEMVVASTESPRKSMDHLSSEEFRFEVESFIAKQKKTQIRDNRASSRGYLEV